jgi:hypothetical protein
VLVCLTVSILRPHAARAADALSLWNDGAAKRSIVAFVEAVTKAGGPSFVAPAERVATFDNDGTLWAEQPLYFQLAFGNSDGDLQMLQWTAAGSSARFCLASAASTRGSTKRKPGAGRW